MNKVFRNIILFGIFGSLIQTIIYYFTIQVLWYFGRMFHQPINTDFTWKYSILYSCIIFFIFIFLNNSVLEFFPDKKNNFKIVSLSIITYIIIYLFIMDIHFWPYKTLLLQISGIIPIALKYIFDVYRINSLNHKSKIAN